MSRAGVVLIGLLLLLGAVAISLYSRSGPSKPQTPAPGVGFAERVKVVLPVEVPPSSASPLEAAPVLLQAQADPLVLANNAAAELLGKGELQAALAMFEDCVRQRPENPTFRANLGETLLRVALAQQEERKPQLAMDALERAMALLPERDGLGPLLKRWREEAEVELDHWSESSDLLELSYDVKRPDLLDNSRLVMDHLERGYGDLRLWFGVDPVRDLGRNKIRVVLYGDEDFDRLTGLGDWAGGVFDGVVRIAVGKLLSEQASWRRTMTHELAHAFIYALGGRDVPGWLNEGLAQWLESESPDLARARRRLETQRFGLDQLKDSLATWTDKNLIAQAYAQSLLMVDLLQHNHGEEVLRLMIKGCKAGVDPAQSFEDYTSVSLASALEFLH